MWRFGRITLSVFAQRVNAVDPACKLPRTIDPHAALVYFFVGDFNTRS
jgi:hypothetical protein